VISVELARRLQRAGVSWSPAAGDRFVIPDRDLDEQVFAVSDMVVEVHELPRGGRLLAFNGTTEWALDSIMQADVVWLPSEAQLRTMLGEAFVSLHAVPGGYVVVVDDGDKERRHVDVHAADAYARALLALLAHGLPPADEVS
jgi:hypothetical protein